MRNINLVYFSSHLFATFILLLSERFNCNALIANILNDKVNENSVLCLPFLLHFHYIFKSCQGYRKKFREVENNPKYLGKYTSKFYRIQIFKE